MQQILFQENAPERLPLKQELLARIDTLAMPEIVISSSTSGFPVSELQARCSHPERIVVGHPFNPPYLMPLVEVVGGRHTAPATIDGLAAFYSSIGKRVLKVRAEVPGFIANRLQEAVWREALALIASDVATVEDIDTALSFGPGLRWSFMGPFLQMALTGGEGGAEHSLDHFAPDVRRPWGHAPLPELSPALRERIVAGCAREVAGRSSQDLARERDAKLIAVLDALGL